MDGSLHKAMKQTLVAFHVESVRVTYCVSVLGGHFATDVGVHQLPGAGEETTPAAERQAEADAAGDETAGQ